MILGIIRYLLDLVKSLGLMIVGAKLNQGKHDKRRADNAEKETQRWANRPRSAADAIKRLRELAKRSKD